ncbi:MAG: hypothetical protein LBQ00_01555 [Syntrophobacterales bacterium]|jgi:uncharacterized SAM-binding protein YcdF (DUF218 family)|nr:hypothetical protein [Syntrophobacterales bacterium]
MKTRAKYIWGAIGALAIIALTFAFLSRKTILLRAGCFMAPRANHIEGVADVAILEGMEFIKRNMITVGLDLLSSGKAKRLAIVLHKIAPDHRPFAINEDYPSSVRRELKNFGVRDTDFVIIVTHIHNPITLVSAKGVLEVLSKDGVKSALLVSSGFHTRRSLLVYQYLSIPLNIKIYPVACLDAYDLDNWWNQDEGQRDFFSEAQKLVFYLAKGYIPLKLRY